MVRNLPAYAVGIRDVRLIPGSGTSPGGGHGNPFQYSCLENLILPTRTEEPGRLHLIAELDRLKRLSTHAYIGWLNTKLDGRFAV